MDFKRFIYSIIRFGNSHGFGVQSPFAYRFIKEVARENYPYYAYNDLLTKYPNDNTLAFHRFLLRFSNFMQTNSWTLLDADKIDLEYIKSGCKSYHLVDLNYKPQAIVVKNMSDWSSFLNQYSSCLTFDFYDCGVIFLDKSKQLGHYKLVLKS